MPENPVDHAAVLDAYNAGAICKPDYEFLSRQLDDMSTAEGADLAAMKAAFTSAFKPVVDPEDPDAEAKAGAQKLQLEKTLEQRVDRMRTACKDPRDLFDEAKPDYIRSAFELVPQYVPRNAQSEAAAQPTAPQAPTSALGGPGPVAVPDQSAAQPAPPEVPYGGSIAPTQSHAPTADPQTDAGPRDAATGTRATQDNEPSPRLPDTGLFRGVIRLGLTKIGVEPEEAQLFAEAIAIGASAIPLVNVALAFDDLATAIRKNDHMGMLSAMVSLMPAGRAGELLKLAARVGGKAAKPKEPGSPKTEGVPPADAAGTKGATATPTTEVARSETASPPGPAAARATDTAQTALPTAAPPRSPAMARLVESGLDRYMPKLNPEKVAAALKRGTAKEIAGGIGFRSHGIFKRVVDDPDPDTDSHHLVEQRPTNPQNPYLVHHNHNILNLPQRPHQKVGGFYSSKQDGSDKTVRERLTDRPFDEQHEAGINIVKRFVDPED